MGRPQKEIDKEIFENLCSIQCTKQEIADWFCCSEDTIERFCKREYEESFAVVFSQKRKKGAISLRRKQWQIAMSGNTSMLIFLGKQYLGQSDKQQVDIGEVNNSELLAWQKMVDEYKQNN